MRGDGRQGAVLVVVLLVMAAAMMLVLECGKYLRIDYASAANQRTMIAGGALLRSGLELARQALVDDLRLNGDNGDHLFDSWGGIQERFEVISDSLQSGDLSGVIDAEDGRISLNALDGEEGATNALDGVFVRLVQRLCERHGIQADPEDYLAAVKVWLGASDTKRDRDWYAMQDPAYAVPGKSFRTSRELLLVRWRGASDEDRHLLYFGTEDIPGLREYVTVWGEGLINVNMARPDVVAALPPDPRNRDEFVHAVLEYRSKGEHLLSGQWYNDIATRVGLDMSDFPSSVLSTRSTVFRVNLSAGIGAGRLNSTTVVRRVPGRCVILYESIY